MPIPTETLEEQVRNAVEPLSRLYDEPGFGKTQVDFESRIATLYFKGEPPAAALAARGTDKFGVTVRIVDIPYSEAELSRLAELLLDASSAAELNGAPPVSMVGRREAMDGLVVYLPAEAYSKAVADDDQRNRLTSAYAEVAGVPVDLAKGEYHPQTRGNDSPPWQGGAQITFPGTPQNNICTTGFAVLDNETGQGRLLTAGHCDDAHVGSRVEDFQGQDIAPGTATSWAPAYESLLIDPTSSPATIGQVYGGPYNAQPGDARYDLDVRGSAPPSEDDKVCVSGANGGERCNKLIEQTSVNFPCPNYGPDCLGFIYGASSGITTMDGDSGAPVYVKRNDGSVGARGVHSGGVVATTCPSSWRFNPHGECSSYSIAVGIHRLEDRWTVHVEYD